jgi:hypothetical protein
MAPRALSLALAIPLIATAQGEARWSAPDRVPDSAGFGTPYDIAINHGGRIAVAFARGGIRVAIRGPNGGWEPTAEISRTDAAVASPTVAVDASGDMTVAWLEASGSGPPLSGPYKIRATSGDGHGRWGKPVTLGRSNHFELAEPQLAINERGDAVVAWRGLRRDDPSGGTEAVFLAYQRAGHKFKKGRPIVERLKPRRVYDHKVGLDAAGRAFVVWTTSEGPTIRFIMRRPGGRFGPLRSLSASPASRPNLAVAGDGGVIVAWRAAELDSEGEGFRYGAPWAILRGADGRWTPARRLSTVPIYSPLIAASAFGRAVVAWAPPPNPDGNFAVDPDLRYSARNRGGDLLPEVEVPGVPAGAESFAPARRLGMLQDGTSVVVAARDHEIVATEMRWGGTFGPLRTLAGPGEEPLVATAGRRLAVAYAADRPRGPRPDERLGLGREHAQPRRPALRGRHAGGDRSGDGVPRAVGARAAGVDGGRDPRPRQPLRLQHVLRVPVAAAQPDQLADRDLYGRGRDHRRDAPARPRHAPAARPLRPRAGPHAAAVGDAVHRRGLSLPLPPAPRRLAGQPRQRRVREHRRQVDPLLRERPPRRHAPAVVARHQVHARVDRPRDVRLLDARRLPELGDGARLRPLAPGQEARPLPARAARGGRVSALPRVPALRALGEGDVRGRARAVRPLDGRLPWRAAAGPVRRPRHGVRAPRRVPARGADGRLRPRWRSRGGSAACARSRRRRSTPTTRTSAAWRSRRRRTTPPCWR